ncbi:hypothetical protein BT96DRAFT_963047 [Gymnopus androsaceus JB14]|uniref:CHAT domain-containing protein n=1 Tax=Gymnopus androsaceus JB14 TaxID=1447944 RepID=A0A6A4IAX2_9AGAR|nr:hypothetical protein BT96DRAFT_963047 [Gymnopus androsaceus JB14]
MPDGQANKPGWLSNLGTALRSRFGYLGELSDIENAIVALKQAVELTPNGNPNKPTWLSNLGNAYKSKFDHLGELSDTEGIIVALKQALNWLWTLGNAYHDIESAIVALKQAVKLTPDSHDDKVPQLSDLGNAYHLIDIESAIVVQKQAVELIPDTMKQAVELTPVGHADNNTVGWHNLGAALSSRFGHLEELNDIESAIVALKHAVDLTPNAQFGHLKELSDIDNAIVAQKQAVELTPDGHTDKAPWLSNLGSAYQSQFDHLRELRDIESAMAVLKQAIELTPDGHTSKPHRLHNLGAAFQSRFHHLGELSDIDSAIVALKQAAELTPDSHANKPHWLGNLGNAYQSQFNHLGKLTDIESAIIALKQVSLKQAIELTPDGHANKPALLNNLSNAYQSQFGHSAELSDIENAIVVQKQALELTPDGHAASLLSSSKPHVQLDAAIKWSKLCPTPALAVQAYTRFFELIPQVVWLGKTVSHRYEELPHIGRVIGAAAATAISTGNLPLAVEWLDEGRSIIWGQILQLRSPLDDLRQKDPRIAKELEMVAQALQNTGTSIKNDFVDSGIKEATVEEEAQKHRRLAGQYKDLIMQIRCLDGFANFMKPKKLAELASAATYGPVITVNVDECQCDALILCSSGAVIHVPLPTFSLKQAQQLHLKLLSSLHTKGVRIDRNGDQDIIPHITWCPTGPLTLLPLHAAGIYGGPTERNINISDFVAKVIQKYTSNTHTCHLNHDAATAKAVMQEMSKYDFIHFACHGIQDIQDPLHSAFALYDQKLKLKALMSLSLNDVQLAVLSACQTATGDENLPEEAVHLAAGMLAVGYPSVIATLWSIGDKEAPLIADQVYANLLGHHDNSQGEKKSKMTPAYALHEATQNLRKAVGETNFEKWVPFIHLGV